MKEASTELSPADLTSVESSSPHWLRYAIRGPHPDHPEREIELANWAHKYPTRDAADSHRQDILEEMRIMRGEPEQAWSEVALRSRCPNPALLSRLKNLHMTLVPARQQEIKPPDDHPYFTSKRIAADIERANAPTPETTGAGRPERRPLPPPPRSPGSEHGGADPGPTNQVRKRAPRTAPKVPRSGGKRKASSGKKQGQAKKAVPKRPQRRAGPVAGSGKAKKKS